MLHRLRDLSDLLKTPGGRRRLRRAFWQQMFPLLSPIARVHRKTLGRRTRVVVVVGSLGKSTTTRAVRAALGMPPVARSEGNARTAVARILLRTRPWTRHAPIEVGIARTGMMIRYARMLAPDVTVVTSIASEHLSSFGSLEVTRDEKAHMVRALPRMGAAVLNGDDPHVMWMAGATRARVVTFGFGDGCDVRASDVRLDWPHGTRFRLHAPGVEQDASIRLIGRPMVSAVLAALAVAHAEGVPLDEALARLALLPPTPGRLDPVTLPGGAIMLRDDFKSTLETVHAALDTLAEIPAERRIVVLGDVSEPPGSQGPIYRAIGARVAGIAQHLIVFGGNYQRYASGARPAGMPGAAIVNAHRSPRLAAEALGAMLRPGDVVLLKGRDTQRLDRVRLILQGRRVRCDIGFCALKVACEFCPMLERGWPGGLDAADAGA